MISVWWLIVAVFAGVGLGMFVFALMAMAGSEPTMQLPPEGVAEQPMPQ